MVRVRTRLSNPRVNKPSNCRPITFVTKVNWLDFGVIGQRSMSQLHTKTLGPAVH